MNMYPIRLILTVVLVFLLSSFVNAEYWTGTVTATHFYSLNETSGTNAEDTAGSDNGTATAATAWNPTFNESEFNSGSFRPNGDVHINLGTVSDISMTTPESSACMSVWINQTDIQDQHALNMGDRFLVGFNVGANNPATGGGCQGNFSASYYDGGAERVTCSDVTAVIKTKYRICFVMDGAGDEQFFYVNGQLAGSSTHANNVVYVGSRAVGIGGSAENPGRIWQNWNGSIDEVWMDDGVTTPADIQADFDLFAPPPPIVPIINTILRNLSFDDIDFTTKILETDPFYIMANYTILGQPIDTGECHFNATNITAHLFTDSGNQTLSDASSQVSLRIDESNHTLINDNYHFSVCRENLKTPLQVTINTVLVETIDQNVIPLCSLGSHEDFTQTTQFNNDTIINISLTCSGCNGGNRQLTIVTDGTETMHYDRTYLQHGMPLNFNVTTQLYDFLEHTHQYIGNPTSNITVLCNSTRNESIFEVTGRNLTIEIISIDDIPFTDGMTVQANDTTRITTETRGDIIISVMINISYANGTRIRNISEETILLTNLELGRSSGVRNITVRAVDNEGDIAIKRGFFVYNDTTNPTITWVTPLQIGSEFTIGSDLMTNIVVLDVNLFAWNMTIIGPDTNIQFSQSATGLDATSATITENITLNELGFWTIKVFVADDHTMDMIPDYQFITEKDSILYDNRIRITGENASSSSTTKHMDRYDFSFTYPPEMKSSNKVFYVESNSVLNYRSNSGYKAHFVDFKNRRWIDFEGLEGEPVVTRISDNKYRIAFPPTDKDMVTFSSIGGINVVTQEATFEVISGLDYNVNLIEHTQWFNTEALELDTTAGIFLWFFLFGILVFLAWVSLSTQTPIFFLLTGLYGLFYAMLLFSIISAVAGIMIGLFGVVFILYGILMTKS